VNPIQYLTKLRELLISRKYRKRIFLCLLLSVLLIFIIPLIFFERTLRASADSNSAKLRDMIILSNDYKMLKEKISVIESKSSNPQAGGITNLVNDITVSLGIKEKMKSIKGVSSRQLKGNISEETAEIFLEKVTMNELINLFHKIETMPVVISVKKTSIKKSFEKPDLLDVIISLALFNIQQETKP